MYTELLIRGSDIIPRANQKRLKTAPGRCWQGTSRVSDCVNLGICACSSAFNIVFLKWLLRKGWNLCCCCSRKGGDSLYFFHLTKVFVAIKFPRTSCLSGSIVTGTRIERTTPELGDGWQKKLKPKRVLTLLPNPPQKIPVLAWDTYLGHIAFWRAPPDQFLIIS